MADMDTLPVLIFFALGAVIVISAFLSGPTYGVFGLGLFPRKRARRTNDRSGPDEAEST